LPANLSRDRYLKPHRVDEANSTLVPLNASESFTGEWTEILGYSTITINAITDAPAILFYQFSADGVNVLRSVQLSRTNSLSLGIHNLAPVARFGRVMINNGTSDMSELTCQVILSPNNTDIVSRAGQTIDDFTDVNTVRLSGDPLLDEADTRQSSRSVISKFGLNTNVAAATEELISGIGTLPYAGFLTASLPMRVKAGGDAQDSSAGTGARSIIIEGLDDNWEFVTGLLITSGASASAATSTSFRRVFRAYVSGSGGYGNSNAAAITIQTSDGTADVLQIPTVDSHGGGQTVHGAYTVPEGKIAFCRRASVSVEGNKAADVYFWQRQKADVVTTPFTSPRIWSTFTGIQGNVEREFKSYVGPFPSKTDIYVTAIGPSGGAGVASQFDLVIIDET